MNADFNIVKQQKIIKIIYRNSKQKPSARNLQFLLASFISAQTAKQSINTTKQIKDVSNIVATVINTCPYFLQSFGRNIIFMSGYQRKSNSKKQLEDGLFTPRNLKTQEQHDSIDFGKQESTKTLNKQMDLRQTLLIQGRPTIKNIQKKKGSLFLNNIKHQLTSLKTQVDRIIKNDSQETSYQGCGFLKNIKQSNSQNQSECSLGSEDNRDVWKYRVMKKQPEESSIMTDLAERKVKFYQEENQVLKNQLNKLKNKYKEYRSNAQSQITMLHNRLEETQTTIANNQQELLIYKRQVEEQMHNIKRVIRQNVESKRQNDISSSRTSVKSLEDQNSSLRKSLTHLKQQLLTKQKNYITDQNKYELVVLQNERLKKQLQELNLQFQVDISNTTLYKSGQSHINFQLSRSKIEQQDSRNLLRKDSPPLKSLLRSINSESRYEQMRRQYESIVQKNDQLNKQTRYLMNQLQEKNQQVFSLQKQKQYLMGKIQVLEDPQKQNVSEKIQQKNTIQMQKQQNDKDLYISQLQQKISRMTNDHFEQINRIRSQLPESSPSENPHSQWIQQDILSQQDSTIQSLKRQIMEKNQQFQKLRYVMGNLSNQLRNSRYQLQVSGTRFAQQKKQFASQLQATINNLRSEMSVVQHVNEQLMDKIKNINEDRMKKEEFIRKYLNECIQEKDRVEVQKIFEDYKVQFANDYLKDQIFREARIIKQLQKELTKKE